MHEPTWIHSALERHERALIAFAARIVGDVETAREVVQETFLKLCTARREDVEPKLVEWLFTTCRNAALDQRRRLGARGQRMEAHEMDTHPDPNSAVSELETKDESARVLKLLARLPQKQREVLQLRFGGGLSYKQIASATGDTIGNVSWLMHAGLKTLRERLSGGALQGRS
jgi:RNA polymerase sigma-70 factor (ECF subfamily)